MKYNSTLFSNTQIVGAICLAVGYLLGTFDNSHSFAILNQIESAHPVIHFIAAAAIVFYAFTLLKAFRKHHLKLLINCEDTLKSIGYAGHKAEEALLGQINGIQLGQQKILRHFQLAQNEQNRTDQILSQLRQGIEEIKFDQKRRTPAKQKHTNKSSHKNEAKGHQEKKHSKTAPAKVQSANRDNVRSAGSNEPEAIDNFLDDAPSSQA